METNAIKFFMSTLPPTVCKWSRMLVTYRLLIELTVSSENKMCHFMPSVLILLGVIFTFHL